MQDDFFHGALLELNHGYVLVQLLLLRLERNLLIDKLSLVRQLQLRYQRFHTRQVVFELLTRFTDQFDLRVRHVQVHFTFNNDVKCVSIVSFFKDCLHPRQVGIV